ncbi:MAG: VOC family protein [Acidimicrobiia bacterium]
MSFQGISWVGHNVPDFKQSVEFFNDLAGLELTHRDNETEVAHFRLGNGDIFEVFGPSHPEEADRGQQLAMAFEVDDLEKSRAEMEARGVNFVTKIETWKDHAWCYFETPDGVVFEIKQSGRRPERS